jgi:hypothetical protein
LPDLCRNNLRRPVRFRHIGYRVFFRGRVNS